MRRAAAAALVLLALGVYAGLRFEVTTDITHFLPSASDRALATLSRSIAESGLSRTMVLSVQPPAAAAGLAETLAAHPEVAWLERGPAPDLGEVFFELYHPRRFHFLSEEPERAIPELLTDDALADAARELKRQLGLPAGVLVKRVAPGDPLLAFKSLLDRLEALGAGGLRVEGDQFLSADGQHAIVFLGTRSGAFDATAQGPLLDALDAACAAATATCEASGVNRYAVLAEREIRADVTRIGVVSTAGVVLLFLLMFGSLRLLLTALLPLVAGLVVALAVGFAAFDRLHGLTLAVGASLIGVCIDYPIHLFNHHTLSPDPAGPDGTLARIWPGLLLGALTTVAGFAGLAWTSFPGIREVAVFASVGVLAALLATRVLLPPLMSRQPRSTRLQRAAAEGLALGLRSLGASPASRRALWLLPIAALVLGAWGLSQVRWNDDVQALTRIDPDLRAEDDRVRARVGQMEPGRFVVGLGADEAAALAVNDAVAARLDAAVEAGELGSFRSLHTLLWSPDLQQRNVAALRAGGARAADSVERVFAAESFRAAAFAPFRAALSADPAPPLTFDDLLASPLVRMVRPFRVETPDGPAFLTFLRDVRSPEALAARLADLDGARYLDQRQLVNSAYGEHRARSLELVLVGLLAVLAMVALRYRRPGLTMAAFLPALLAAAVTVGALALAGHELHLLHLVALLLVLSMGVDYGVFLAEASRHEDGLPATVLSIVIACLSTVLSFGLLAMSSNPALEAIGLTAGVGVLASLVLAPTTLILTTSKATER